MQELRRDACAHGYRHEVDMVVGMGGNLAVGGATVGRAVTVETYMDVGMATNM